MSLDLFITAAGTEIGKTFVTVALIDECTERGISCDALKPVISGYDDSPQTDTARLLSALRLPVNEHTIDTCSPWRFREAVSPHIAAALEGRQIRLSDLIEFCKRPSDARLRLIEGIGGTMVPINDDATTLDWMAALGAPVILVVGTYLGSISHALTAYESLRSRGLELQGIVVNESIEQPVPLEQTLATIERFCSPTPIACVARDDPDELFVNPAASESLLEALQLLPGGG
jgi:dethiobiotin synthetase